MFLSLEDRFGGLFLWIFYLKYVIIIPSKRKEFKMNFFEKLLNVLGKNLGYAIIFAIAIIFFAYFSDGLIPGIITAASALVAYICAVMLYKEIKKEFSSTKAVVKEAPAKKTSVKKKTSTKKNSKK